MASFAPMIRSSVTALLLALAPALAWAQAPPLVDPAHALGGKVLLEALRGGGYVMIMRHGNQARFTPTCKPEEPNLSPVGEAQARRVGKALHDLRIPVGSVRASKLCRAIETAQLLDLGPVSSTPDLNPGTAYADLAKLLAEAPAAGTNTILVSHAQNSEKVGERVMYELTEIIVYRPDGQGGTTVVARIRPEDWDALAR